ncbi:CBS domain-containing hemolysin [Chromobacterium vaccinii]|uniref:hemolysin family protein n=1 Tax=Chromobacterium vaccinii TaxID=1108595 RepID=UPI000A679383|nr:hemolysin family protein [Chromobacterium vaccinii]QND82492.1 CBS domain-containing hemolysin [Chromobacterium vaccinii]QND87722.1 CBS domain-containing hemolysin [Chromobacterium vaccinii]
MEILLLLGLILLNAVFAMAEIAIVSSRKVRLLQKAEDGHKGARAALALASEPTRFLSTVQIGITSISILSGVYGEAALSEHLRGALLDVPLLAPYSKPLSVALMVLFITTLSLILGELVPKRLALLNPERVAMALARPMLLLSRASGPLVQVFSRVTDGLLRLLGAKKSDEPSITEDEIRTLMEQGADEGVFDRAEQELVENIFRLDNRKASAVMTPRKDVVILDLEDGPERNRELLLAYPFSHFPVCRGDTDQVIGVLNAKTLLDRLLRGEPLDFAAELSPPLYVPSTCSLMQLLEQFKQARSHSALVVDEYGELEGLVSINNVMEAIVGDLPDIDGEIDEIVQREDGSWLVDGMVSLEHFREFFELEAQLPGEAGGNIHTLAGVILYQLGRVPSVTDRFEWNGFSFEVVDMDRTRVDKILVQRHHLPQPEFESI